MKKVILIGFILLVAGCMGRRGPRSAHSTNQEEKIEKEHSQEQSDVESSRAKWAAEEPVDVVDPYADAGAEEDENENKTTRITPDRQSIQRTIRSATPAVRSCYEIGLQTNPNLAGLVAVSIVVGMQGEVKNVEIIANNTTLNDPNVLSCIQQSLTTLTFDAFRDVGGTIRYPFVFQPSSP